MLLGEFHSGVSGRAPNMLPQCWALKRRSKPVVNNNSTNSQWRHLILLWMPFPMSHFNFCLYQLWQTSSWEWISGIAIIIFSDFFIFSMSLILRYILFIGSIIQFRCCLECFFSVTHFCLPVVSPIWKCFRYVQLLFVLKLTEVSHSIKRNEGNVSPAEPCDPTCSPLWHPFWDAPRLNCCLQKEGWALVDFWGNLRSWRQAWSSQLPSPSCCPGERRR